MTWLQTSLHSDLQLPASRRYNESVFNMFLISKGETLLGAFRGDLCLQRRSYAKDNSPGLLSSSCAGHVDAGEAYVEAAVRELGEELGVRVAPAELQEVDYAPQHEELGREFVRSYVLRRPAEPCILAPFEVDAVLWRHPAEVAAWAAVQPGIFSRQLLHLLARPAIRRALGWR